MIETIYDLKRVGDIATPALVYYEDVVRKNAREAIRLAGGAERLWPHVKTHKAPAMLKLLMGMGIGRFKTATIAESEMAARMGAPDILMAYPLVGPAIDRFILLTRMYPGSRFWAVGDDAGQLLELGRRANGLGFRQRTLVDVDIGMRRTGVPAGELERFYRKVGEMPGLELQGMHCYDGHNHQEDPAKRLEEAIRDAAPVHAARLSLEKDGMNCGTMVMGGSPTFPCHAQTPGTFLSPGTIFVHDYGYLSRYPDLAFTPGGVILSRVISRPGGDLFTLDLGYKGIASDPAGVRGVIANLPETEPVSQSEEHWVFRMAAGARDVAPRVGDVLYVIPTHICPTSALYSSILMARDGEIADRWEVTARDRKLSV